MLLIAGYERYEENVEQYTPYLPAVFAAVLIIMGFGFITGVLWLICSVNTCHTPSIRTDRSCEPEASSRSRQIVTPIGTTVI